MGGGGRSLYGTAWGVFRHHPVFRRRNPCTPLEELAQRTERDELELIGNHLQRLARIAQFQLDEDSQRLVNPLLRRNARLLLHHHTQIMGRHAELRSVKLDFVLRLGIIVDQPDETLDGLLVARPAAPLRHPLRIIQRFDIVQCRYEERTGNLFIHRGQMDKVEKGVRILSPHLLLRVAQVEYEALVWRDEQFGQTAAEDRLHIFLRQCDALEGGVNPESIGTDCHAPVEEQHIARAAAVLSEAYDRLAPSAFDNHHTDNTEPDRLSLLDNRFEERIAATNHQKSGTHVDIALYMGLAAFHIRYNLVEVGDCMSS